MEKETKNVEIVNQTTVVEEKKKFHVDWKKVAIGAGIFVGGFLTKMGLDCLFGGNDDSDDCYDADDEDDAIDVDD